MFAGLLCMQSVIFTMQTDKVVRKIIIEKAKKRYYPSRTAIGRTKSQPIAIAGSGEFAIAGETIVDILRSSGSSNDLVYSPDDRVYFSDDQTYSPDDRDCSL